MTHEHAGRLAILYPGDAEAWRTATPTNNRFAPLFSAFAAAGIHAEPAVYHDTFCDAVHEQLLRVDAVLVWVNPIEGGRDRNLLDAMLRKVAAAGVFVSAHPDIILKLGTKEVLYQTRELGWGSDVHLYRTMEQLTRELPARLTSGGARVLKQYRGHSGIGVWKVSLVPAERGADAERGPGAPQPDTLIRVRHAQRGSSEEELTLAAFLRRCEPYFAGEGRVIDQTYQERLPEGMIRCYLVHDRVAGFGHQAVNALFPAPPGAAQSDAPQPGPRLYYPPDQPEFQAVKALLERDWLPAAQRLLDIPTECLPVLWDCDFLLGPKDSAGVDSYVLCEINVSSVAPYPDSATPLIVEATRARLLHRPNTAHQPNRVAQFPLSEA
jgi:hypothetical protein